MTPLDRGGPAGAPFYADAFLENLIVTPAKPTTWGKIKTMYR